MSMVSRRYDMPFAQPRWIFFFTALVGHSQAQEVNRSPATAAVEQHTSAARAHAGTNWTAAVDFLAKNTAGQSERPFFLYVALPAPHTPWLPARKYRGKSGASMYGEFAMMVDDVVGKIVIA